MRRDFQMKVGGGGQGINSGDRQPGSGKILTRGGGGQANPIEGAADVDSGEAQAAVAFGLRG